jgi:hypothetical protein
MVVLKNAFMFSQVKSNPRNRLHQFKSVINREKGSQIKEDEGITQIIAAGSYGNQFVRFRD